jgi:3-isopropylmalate/(R)-2-methylmalate dehydratase small subunit
MSGASGMRGERPAGRRSTIESPYVAFLEDDVDTDQIIPARFLTTVERRGLAAGLFADRRHRSPGEPGDTTFPLDHPAARGCAVLLAGERFGCGSSREHAVWALVEAGFAAVVARSFGDIFRQNALQNGLLPVVPPLDAWLELARLAGGAGPGAPAGPPIRIEVATAELVLPDGSRHRFPLDPFARVCWLDGVDELGWLLSHREAIERHEAHGTAERGA